MRGLALAGCNGTAQTVRLTISRFIRSASCGHWYAGRRFRKSWLLTNMRGNRCRK